MTELKLSNWRSHESTTVPLTAFTLVVGPNGVGKSSVLEGLSLLGNPFTNNLRTELLTNEAFNPVTIRNIHRAASGGPAAVRVNVHSGFGDWTDGLELREVKGTFEPMVLWQQPSDEPASLRSDDMNGKKPGYADWPKGLPIEAYGFCSTVSLRLDPTQLAAPCAHDATSLRADGYGLATVLAEMKLNDTPRFTALMEHARKVVPILRDLSFGRTQTREQRAVSRHDGPEEVWRVETVTVPLRTLHLSFADAPALPADAASEGTLFVLGVLAALLQPSRPALVLLDDLDRALHPRAQRMLVECLKSLQTSFDIQIVATTHSPYIIDSFEASSVVVLTREPDEAGRVTAHRLSDHPKAELLDALQTGEFWTAHGERDWPASATAP